MTLKTKKEYSTTHEEVIFTKGLKPMRCLAILMQNLRAQISTSLESEMTKESRIKGEEQLNELKKATKIFSDNFDDYKQEDKEKMELLEKCNVICRKIKKQYHRRILIYGVAEIQN